MSPRRLVIAGDEETGEMYLAELLDDDPRGQDPPPHPIVRILRVVRYPNQRAIMQPSVAVEFPAVEYGAIIRMGLLDAGPSPGEANEYTKAAYEQSLRAAITQALPDARSDAERAILQRHLSGDFRRKRVFIRFTEQNWLRIARTEGANPLRVSDADQANKNDRG